MRRGMVKTVYKTKSYEIVCRSEEDGSKANKKVAYVNKM